LIAPGAEPAALWTALASVWRLLIADEPWLRDCETFVPRATSFVQFFDELNDEEDDEDDDDEDDDAVEDELVTVVDPPELDEAA
jgi:hypothetical protein